MPKPKRHSVSTLLLFLFVNSLAAAEGPTNPVTDREHEIRLNQIQVIGTHNSYHIAPQRAVLDLIAARDAELARSLDYTHRPLPEQLGRLGIRQIEFDVFADPKGGLFAKPLTAKMIPDASIDDPQNRLLQPGLKVLHVPDIDYRTSAFTLVEALRQVHIWSLNNPRHFPVLIMIEVKQDSIGKEYTQPHPFGTAELNAIDAEVLSVFDHQEILKPDDVRNGFKTLREAVISRGWPLLKHARGKVMFAMDNGGEVRDLYLQGHEVLNDRLLFVTVPELHPAAAFMKINDPIGEFETIQKMVKKGFLVRTRADSGTKESRLHDTSRREKAFASGAQFISTDYPEPDQRFSDYAVRFEGNVIARANPINAPAEWRDRDFDRVGR